MPSSAHPNLPAARLHVVTGKGGVGKTTVASALALALASTGKRVLVAEVEGRQGLSQTFDVPPLGTDEVRLVSHPSGGALWETTLSGHTARLHAAANAGASVSSQNGAIALTGPHPGCADHGAILLDTAGRVSTLAGTCEIRGTAGNDVIIEADGIVAISASGRGRRMASRFCHAQSLTPMPTPIRSPFSVR